MSAGHSPEARMSVFKRDDWTCRRCGFRQTEDERRKIVARGALGRYLTIDHIVPRSRGGRNAITNLQTLCNVCNGEKADACDPADMTPARIKRTHRKRKARSKLLSGIYRSKAGEMLIHDPRCDGQFCMNTCPVYLDRGVYL